MIHISYIYTYIYFKYIILLFFYYELCIYIQCIQCIRARVQFRMNRVVSLN